MLNEARESQYPVRFLRPNREVELREIPNLIHANILNYLNTGFLWPLDILCAEHGKCLNRADLSDEDIVSKCGMQINKDGIIESELKSVFTHSESDDSFREYQ